MMGIIAALNMAVTQRLQLTIAGLKKNLVVKFQSLVKLMSPDKSWQEYRNLLDTLSPPLVPYLGVFLTDLTFIQDGNKDTVDGKINWKKIQMVNAILEKVKKFQKIPFCFSIENPAFTMLSALPFLDDDTNFQISRLIEPKNVDLKTLLAL